MAKAATICADRSLNERIADLKAAYARFLEEPVDRDPKCIAKQAIVQALVALECADVAFYLAGLHYQQLEPVWGGSEDSAVEVRCSSAMGLVSTGYFGAMVELARLLCDSKSRAREGAVRAIACGNPQTAEVLLRFKAMTGDPEPEVIGECFTALMSINPDESLLFVAERLSDLDNAIRDLAALALGQSRHDDAIAHFKAAWDDVLVSPDFRKVLIRAAAVHRSEAAFDWLLTIIEDGHRTTRTPQSRRWLSTSATRSLLSGSRRHWLSENSALRPVLAPVLR